MVCELKNNATFVKEYAKSWESKDMSKPFLEYIGVALTSFFLSYQNAVLHISPFGIAFVSACNFTYMPFALAGSVLGYSLSPSENILPLRYLATHLAIVAIARCLDTLGLTKNGQIASPLISFGCCFATGFTMIVAQGFDVYLFMLYLAEAVIAGGTAYFFKMCFNITSIKKGVYSISSHELAGIVVCSSILLMSFSTFEFGGFSPARTICVLIILVCSYFAREAGGSITGVTLGLVIGLASQSQSLVVGYSFGGLLAGVFSPLGAIGVCCAFLIAHGVSIILQGLSTQVALYFAEAIIACIIFLFLPQKLVERIRLFFSCATILPSVDGLRSSVVTRLCTASDAVDELSQSVKKVSNLLSQKSTVSSPDDLFYRVEQNVCNGCGNRAFCWQHCFNDTMNVFNDAFSVLRTGNDITIENVPRHFSARCIKLTTLVDCFNKEYGVHTANIATNAKLSQMRHIVAQQFDSMSNLLKDLSLEFDEERTFDDETASRVSALLSDFGINAIGVSCMLDRFSRMRIEIRCENVTEKVDRIELTNAINELCSREFDLPSSTVLDNETLVNFSQKAFFNVSTGICQLQSKGENYCGDYYECFFDGRGRYIMIISDGMGTGTMAAIDSTMTASLLSQLIRSGFGFECALKIINSALLVKSGDESMATLDLICIDLFSGKADFYKAGAAATLVKHGKKISKLEKVALPIGILNEVEFTHSTATLSQGDVILMSSDGAWVDDGKFISKHLKEFEGKNPPELARIVAQDALSKYKDTPNDDITVLTAVIERNN